MMSKEFNEVSIALDVQAAMLKTESRLRDLNDALSDIRAGGNTETKRERNIKSDIEYNTGRKDALSAVLKSLTGDQAHLKQMAH